MASNGLQPTLLLCAAEPGRYKAGCIIIINEENSAEMRVVGEFIKILDNSEHIDPLNRIIFHW